MSDILKIDDIFVSDGDTIYIDDLNDSQFILNKYMTDKNYFMFALKNSNDITYMLIYNVHRNSFDTLLPYMKLDEGEYTLSIHKQKAKEIFSTPKNRKILINTDNYTIVSKIKFIVYSVTKKQLEKFIDYLLDEDNFKLIAYEGLIDNCSKYETILTEDVIETYTACWYTQSFLDRLLKFKKDKSVSQVKPYFMYSGDYTNYEEEHHFYIFTDKDDGVVVNTYGGIDYVIIKKHNIKTINNLLKNINKQENASKLFDIQFPYENTKFDSLDLYEMPLKLPTQIQFNNVIKTMSNKLTTEENKKDILKYLNTYSL